MLKKALKSVGNLMRTGRPERQAKIDGVTAALENLEFQLVATDASLKQKFILEGFEQSRPPTNLPLIQDDEDSLYAFIGCLEDLTWSPALDQPTTTTTDRDKKIAEILRQLQLSPNETASSAIRDITDPTKQQQRWLAVKQMLEVFERYLERVPVPSTATSSTIPNLKSQISSHLKAIDSALNSAWMSKNHEVEATLVELNNDGSKSKNIKKVKISDLTNSNVKQYLIGVENKPKTVA